MSRPLEFWIIFVWIVAVSGIDFHRPNELQCHSCSGASCLRHISENFGTCSVAGNGGKCFIRLDPDGNTLWGCATPRRWRTQDMRRDGCRLLTQPGFGGKTSVVCLCSHRNHCNSNAYELIANFPNTDSQKIITLLQQPLSTSLQISHTHVTGNDAYLNGQNVFPSGNNLLAKRTFYKQGPPADNRNTILNDISTTDGLKRTTRLPPKYSGTKRSYTIPEKLYKLSPSEVNNVVHGVFPAGPDPFIPKFRDCRIHNGYCEHVCVMSWNGMGFCACHTGYRLAHDLMNCDDINECSTQNGGCEHKCHNTQGSHHCTCRQGYKMADNNRTCDETDECATPERGGCSHGCTNTPGSYTCFCPDGFHLQHDQNTCRDTDECTNGTAQCQQLCENTLGSYTCGCTAGFVLDTDRYSCIDLDECETANGGCNQECINSLGSYVCGCRMGYDFINDAKTCADIDECSEDNGQCDQACTNHEGGYNCTCALGYELKDDNKGCHELIPGDKCVKDNGGCDHCCDVIDASTVQCTCDHGYKLLSNGKTCVDIDECALFPCEGDCINTPGSFTCLCVPGYSLQPDGACVDIQECADDNAGCDDICINTDGSYFCACALGYWLGPDGHKCIDINECKMNNGGCGGICQNSPGSYNCSCAEGYIMDIDGRSCLDVDECSTPSYGGCDQICVNTAGSYICGCADGYRLADDNKNCEDRDECQHNNGGCDQDCYNFRGSFRCQCYPGYARDFLGVCRDIDECLYGLHNCSTFCTNTPGSYQCSCLPGYHVNHDTTECVDDDECAEENGGCQQYCVNTPGAYSCTCADESGFVLGDDGKSCHVTCPELFLPAPGAQACHLAVTDETSSFEEAEEYCRNLHAHAHLVSLEEDPSMAYTEELLSQVADKTQESNVTIWTAGKYWQSISDYVWITSYNVITGFNVTAGADVTSPVETCVLAIRNDTNTSLISADCDQRHHFVCEIHIRHN